MNAVRTAALVPVALLALAACGGSDDPGSAGSNVEVAQDSASSPAAPQDASPQAAATPQDGAARPAQGSCTALPEAADGRYVVADAGTVVVTREGDRLVLGEVTPAQGWTTEETDTEDDEVEVEFRRDGEELDLEAEIEGDAVTVEICADDD